MHPRYLLEIPDPIFAAMLAHARAELPNECVGILAGPPPRPGVPHATVVERYPLVNALASPTRFESDPRSMFEAEKRRRAAEFEFLAIYHSHPNSPPVPSATDLERNYSEEVMNLIISLAGRTPEARAWWLRAEGFEAGEYRVE